MADDKVRIISNIEIAGVLISNCVIHTCQMDNCRISGSAFISNSALEDCDISVGSDVGREEAIKTMADPNFTEEMLIDAVAFYLSAKIALKND